VAVIGAILVSYFCNLTGEGRVRAGRLLPTRPAETRPAGVQLSLVAFRQLLPVSLCDVLSVVLTPERSHPRAYATRYGEHLNENVDLVALGLAKYWGGAFRRLCGQWQPDQDAKWLKALAAAASLRK